MPYKEYVPEDQKKDRRGRPREDLYAKYVEGNEEKVQQAIAEGCGLKGVAAVLGCGTTLVNRIKYEYPEFKELIRQARRVCNDAVETALFKRAIGYEAEDTVTEVKVSPDGAAQTTYVRKIKKHIPPDTTAASFWLKNREPEEWRDKQDIELDTIQPITINISRDDGKPQPPKEIVMPDIIDVKVSEE